MMYGQTQKFSPYVKGIVIANVVAFIMQLLPVIGDRVTSLGALMPVRTIFNFELWRPVSYMFLHSPDMLFHILFNMLILWWFGTELEDLWGGKKFLIFYFICGVGAGFFSFLYLFFGNPYVMVIGASGAVLGVLTAYAHYYPNRQVLLFFIIPIKMRMLVIGYAFFSVFFSFRGHSGNVSHMTHLGGILVAWLYLRFFPLIQSAVEKLAYSREVKRRKEREAQAVNRKKHFEQVIDPILEKISKGGMESLTPAEKKLLEKAGRVDRDLFRGKKIMPM
ncbi:MAG: rhomboid family intramembrane serine protease [Chitinispirillales bacterium]|jgi:membrane associated rhomboid family serine protease|nr:rhomboid family intramembrane serine protease [Chitinispirillales bacterium]